MKRHWPKLPRYMPEVPFYGNRSLAAFHMTLARLSGQATQAGDKLYFWTFTFTQKMAEHLYSRYWAYFIREFEHSWHGSGFSPIYGVKVAQLHKLGGIHYHCVVNQRIPVAMVRRIGKKYNIGWIKVIPVYDVNGIGEYLARYIARDIESRSLRRGISTWGTMFGFDGCRVNSIERTSPASIACKGVKKVLGRKLTFSEIQTVSASMNIINPLDRAAAIQQSKIEGSVLPFTWSWSRLERETEIDGRHPMDGRKPF